ncbi:MAG: hypothetical protein ACI97A_001543 [Planctomycetota bacterium]|jgi:hypothetical protein
MNSNRNRHNFLSQKCSLKLSRVVIPEQQEEVLSEARFQKFLEKEGLSDHAYLQETETNDEVAERRRRLFGLVTGSIAAAAVILSLQMLFGGHDTKPNLNAETGIARVVEQPRSTYSMTSSSNYECRLPLP